MHIRFEPGAAFFVSISLNGGDDPAGSHRTLPTFTYIFVVLHFFSLGFILLQIQKILTAFGSLFCSLLFPCDVFFLFVFVVNVVLFNCVAQQG
jgi:hypothetical protein